MKEIPQITPRAAAALVRSGDRVLVGGFGMTGNPTQVLHALAETDVRGLTYIANNVGEPGLGGGRMLRNGQISRAIGSFFTSNPEAVAAASRHAVLPLEEATCRVVGFPSGAAPRLAVLPLESEDSPAAGHPVVAVV